MPEHELVYFDIPGRGETTRVMLHAAGVKFADTRVPFKDWPTVKKETPLGSLPVLKVDGASHCQSIALGRYASKLAGFYPDDPLEALVVDEVLETCNEIMGKAPNDKDEDEKKKKRIEWQNDGLTQYAEFLESRVQSGGGKSVSSKPSVADLAIGTLVKTFEGGLFDHIDTDFFAKYPGISAVKESIYNEPKIKAYYEDKKE
jgi:glutathione S-transferase